MTIHTNFREKERILHQVQRARGAEGTKSSDMELTWPVRPKNRKTDEAVQKSSSYKQCSLRALTARGSNSAGLRCRDAEVPSWARGCALGPSHLRGGRRVHPALIITQGAETPLMSSINGNSRQQRVTFAWSQSAC